MKFLYSALHKTLIILNITCYNTSKKNDFQFEAKRILNKSDFLQKGTVCVNDYHSSRDISTQQLNRHPLNIKLPQV